MPIDTTWEPRGVLRRFTGAISVTERRTSFRQICADPRFDDLRYMITDYSGVTAFEWSDESPSEIACLYVGPALTNPNFAIVAVTDRPDFLAAIAGVKASGLVEAPYVALPTMAAARQWIAEWLARDAAGHAVPRGAHRAS
jgi:hypothetical protein